MGIAHGSSPGTGSCGCKGRLSPESALRNSSCTPVFLSLEPLTASLASGEVERLRKSIEKSTKPSTPGDTLSYVLDSQLGAERDAASGTLLEAGATLWSKIKRMRREASAELQDAFMVSRMTAATRATAEATLACFGRMCKLAVSRIQEVISSGWVIVATRVNTETALAAFGRYVKVFRGWIPDFSQQARAAAKTGLMKEQPGIPTWYGRIPRVVVAHRRESQRVESRRRSRGPQRRRELHVPDADCTADEDETVIVPDREEKQIVNEESTKQKRTARVCSRIREIDAQYGTTPNNPRVAEIVAQLGTHYDSIERAIEAVYALQLEELLAAEHEQAKHELQRHFP